MTSVKNRDSGFGIRETSAGQAVVDVLKAEKVEFVFGLAGSHVLPIFDALADAPQIRHIVVKQENNAAFMAGMIGYLTGRPGVALVTAGPGATIDPLSPNPLPGGVILGNNHRQMPELDLSSPKLSYV